MNNHRLIARIIGLKVKRSLILLSSVACLTVSARTAWATDSATVRDVRCVVVALHMLSAGAPEQRAAGMMVAMYYFGKIDARSPREDVENLIEQEARRMTPAVVRSDAARCGEPLQRKSEEITRIGMDLAAVGK